MGNIIEVTDINIPELEIFTSYSENQLKRIYEPEQGLFLIESTKVIERAMNDGYEPVAMMMEKKHVDGEAREIVERAGDIPIYVADRKVFSTAFRTATGYELTRGALCIMKRRAYRSVEETISGARRIAILENVVNPTNIGAIFRSAAALNMDAVLLTPACSDPLYKRAARVSMGTVFQIPWTYIPAVRKEKTEEGKGVPGVPPTADYSLIKEQGFKMVAMALKENSFAIDAPELAAEEKLAIVLGTEGDGLANETIADCDYTVMIPMSHGVDSLNVAAASAVAFWELGRK